MNFNQEGIDSISQGIFNTAVETELIRARAIDNFLQQRYNRVKNSEINPNIKGKTIEQIETICKDFLELDLKLDKINFPALNDKNKKTLIKDLELVKKELDKKINILKKNTKEYDMVKEEAYKAGYVDAIVAIGKYLQVLPRV